MSDLEKKLAEETESLLRWREGRDFRLEAFNSIQTECSRCRQDKPHAFILTTSPQITFGHPTTPLVELPIHRVVCRDCLTDNEIVTLLLPALHFVLAAMLRNEGPRAHDNDLQRSLAYVHAWLSSRTTILSRPERDQKEFALRALEGLKSVPIPEIDLNRMYSEIELVLARNMYLAAHPDDLSESWTDFEKRVQVFFRDGASVERLALRDACAKCVEIFRKYFTRKP